MLVSNYISYPAPVIALALSELANPIYRLPTLRFVAENASPCVAEALMGCLISNDMRPTGEIANPRSATSLGSLIHAVCLTPPGHREGC